MANEPVQIVMNPEALRAPRETTTPKNNGTDFFAGRDSAFVEHRARLLSAMRGVLQLIESPSYERAWAGLAHVLVTMRPRAVAKSHRPTHKLFRPKWTPHAATRSIGEPIYAVVPSTLRLVITQMEAAEATVQLKVRPGSTEESPAPSRNRVETGAILSIRLWTEADKRDFTAEAAATWLARPDTGGEYFVELFGSTSSEPAVVARARLVCQNRLEGLRAYGQLDASKQAQDRGGLAMTARVSRSGAFPELPDAVHLQSTRVGRAEGELSVSPVPAHHEDFLAAAAGNPIVRGVSLPPVVRIPTTSGSVMPSTLDAADFARDRRAALPRVGVIDGGVDGPITSWVEERWNLLSAPDRNPSHGTFIAGLLALGGDHNPFLRHQARGCAVFDIDVLPADPSGSGATFGTYYPTGIRGFMDEVEDAVRHFVETRDVRVFNFSLNILAGSPPTSSHYGYAARRLDELARDLDVIVVIAAGNLDPSEQRPEWAANDADAIAGVLASTGDLVGEPAESIYNVSVSAINPPGLHPEVLAGALTRYSRRGPGLRGATKPDFAHVGGSGTTHPTLGTGLASVDETGRVITEAGTSFAAPLVARELAELDDAIQGPVSRETLLALAIHHSTVPALMSRPAIAPAARELVGFGVPASTSDMLEGDDSQITLVFTDVLQPNGALRREFPWPPSLVGPGGRCRGNVRMTVVARPLLAYEHGDERVRVNIEAKLMQQQAEGHWSNRLDPAYYQRPAAGHPQENDLLRESMKWHAVKTFRRNMTGLGPTSTWRFEVGYLTRADEAFPESGIPFTAVLSIADPRGAAPVFQEMRQTLSAMGVQTADIRTAVRTRTRT